MEHLAYVEYFPTYLFWFIGVLAWLGNVRSLALAAKALGYSAIDWALIALITGPLALALFNFVPNRDK